MPSQRPLSQSSLAEQAHPTSSPRSISRVHCWRTHRPTHSESLLHGVQVLFWPSTPARRHKKRTTANTIIGFFCLWVLWGHAWVVARTKRTSWARRTTSVAFEQVPSGLGSTLDSGLGFCCCFQHPCSRTRCRRDGMMKQGTYDNSCHWRVILWGRIGQESVFCVPNEEDSGKDGWPSLSEGKLQMQGVGRACSRTQPWSKGYEVHC